MGARAQNDLTSDQWTPWIISVCTRLGVDPALIDVAAIHDLTREVAHRYERPMAPVSAYIVGIALGTALASTPEGDADPDAAGRLAELIDAVEATLPAPS